MRLCSCVSWVTCLPFVLPLPPEILVPDIDCSLEGVAPHRLRLVAVRCGMCRRAVDVSMTSLRVCVLLSVFLLLLLCGGCRWP